jgi:hypothetical protein
MTHSLLHYFLSNKFLGINRRKTYFQLIFRIFWKHYYQLKQRLQRTKVHCPQQISMPLVVKQLFMNLNHIYFPQGSFITTYSQSNF